MNWQPIGTAPKDGSEFQAWVKRNDVTGDGWWEPKCRYSCDTGAFEIWGRVDYDTDYWDVYWHIAPLAWMDVPERPEFIV